MGTIERLGGVDALHFCIRGDCVLNSDAPHRLSAGQQWNIPRKRECAMCCMELEQRRLTLDSFASGAEYRDAPHNLMLAVLRHVVRCVDERGGTSDPGWRIAVKCSKRAAAWLAREAVTENLS